MSGLSLSSALTLSLAPRAGGGPTVPTLQLTASSILESATSGSTVGVLSVANGSGSYTFTKTADPDAKFAISGSNLNTAAALDYEAAQSHSVTISADNGVDAPVVRAFTINVTNVFEQPSLSALTIPSTITTGTTINITGATSGSTITGTVPSGWTINSGARTIDVSSGAATGSQSWSLVETLADSANSPRTSSGSATVSASSYSAEATAYFAAMTTQPDATRKGLIDTLIVALKAGANAWSALDRFVLFASHDSQSALLDAHDPTKSASAVNSPVFTTDRGFAGDAASSHIDFGEPGNAAGNQMTQNSASMGVWINAQGATSGLRFLAGQTGAAYRLTVTGRNTTGNETFRASDATDSVSRANTGTRLGHRTSVRPDASTKLSYLNGGNQVSVSLASTGVAATNNTVLRAGTNYSDDRAAAAYLGASLTATQVSELHTALNTYLTAIGAN